MWLGLLPGVSVVPLTAQIAPPGDINFIDDLAAVSDQWENNLRPFLIRCFMGLVGVDFAWMAIRLALQQGTLETWVTNVVRKVFFYGFGLALLRHGSDWAEAIISSFVRLADSAHGDPALSNRFLLELCFETIVEMHEGMGFFDGIGLSLFIGLAIVLILVLFAYISFVLIMVYAEAYLILGAGTVILGLAGSEWTKDYAWKYLHFAIVTGIKLFLTILVGKLGVVLIGGWVDDLKGEDIISISKGLISLLIFALLIKTLPAAFADMLSGASFRSATEPVTGSVRMAGEAVYRAAAGAAVAVPSAVRLASVQGRQQGGSVVLGAARNLGSAVRDDLNRHAGRSDRTATALGQRVSARMEAEIRKLDEKLSDPS